MKIEPLFDTKVVDLINEPIQTQKITILKKEKKDVDLKNGKRLKSKLKSNHLFQKPVNKIINWEKKRIIFTILLTFCFFMVGFILDLVYAFIFKSKWLTFIFPSLLSIIFGIKLIFSLWEWKYLKIFIKNYHEELKLNINSKVPNFFNKIYINLHKKQIQHNWITFYIIFYFGIFTLCLWWLQNVSWWIFNFREWIKNLFVNPHLMLWIFTISLILVFVLHMLFLIQRKKRILMMNAYFNKKLIDVAQVEKIKKINNKFYFRIFLISLIIILIIPLIIKIVLKISSHFVLKRK